MGKNKRKRYYMPAEWEAHEGTWLSWPHRFSFRGDQYREELDPIWVAMTKGIQWGEKVHILVYDEAEQKHVEELLQKEEDMDMDKVEFFMIKTDDVWIRDMGPIFVRDEDGEKYITNWKFNGWGAKYPHDMDNTVPEKISEICDFEKIDLTMVLEGGAIEVNGKGSFLAARTSIINDNRNPQFTQREIEEKLTNNLGISNFIWITGLEGEENGDEDTDFHIDGAARFVNENTILYEYDPFMEDHDYLLAAYERHFNEMRSCSAEGGNPLNLIPLPLTRKIVESTGSKGSYLNFYIANKAVLVPTYGDEHDHLALKTIEGFFPGRKAVGIDVSKLYPYGGMIHCVTQQQPL